MTLSERTALSSNRRLTTCLKRSTGEIVNTLNLFFFTSANETNVYKLLTSPAYANNYCIIPGNCITFMNTQLDLQWDLLLELSVVLLFKLEQKLSFRCTWWKVSHFMNHPFTSTINKQTTTKKQKGLIKMTSITKASEFCQNWTEIFVFRVTCKE